jgi:hypothetical protein
MGLAPSRHGENPRKSAVSKVPVPIFHSLAAPRSSALEADGESEKLAAPHFDPRNEIG